MQIFFIVFIRGLRRPYGKGLVGHYTSGHSLNPPLIIQCTPGGLTYLLIIFSRAHCVQVRNRCVVEDGIEHCLINCDKSHNCPTWYVLCTITFLSYVLCLGPALRNLALFCATTLINIHTYLQGGSVAEWLACWTRAILPLTLHTHTHMLGIA